MTDTVAAPLVTISVPTFNRARYLSECLESVRAQTYANLEIVVGDNSSVDETPTVIAAAQARDPRIRSVRHTSNLGMVGNWNALLSHARGEYFVLLSDDDLLAPTAIADLVAACEETGAVFAYSPFFVIDADGTIVDESSSSGPEVEPGQVFIREHLAGRRDVCPAATLYRLGVGADRLQYDDFIGGVCDLWHRILLATSGHVACVNRPLVFYRVHSLAETRQVRMFAESLLRFLERVRAPGSPVSDYTAEAVVCVRRAITMMALSAAARGRLGDAQALVDVMSVDAAPARLLSLRVRLAHTSLSRVAAKARRALLARRAQLHARALGYRQVA
jgi:glycosyltransferase involved in cell wall biosynthesis